MNETKRIERAEACRDEIFGKLKGAAKIDSELLPAISFLLSNTANYSFPFGVDLDRAIRDAKEKGIDVSFLANIISKEMWNDLLQLCMTYGPDDFGQVAAMPVTNVDKRDYLETPEGLEKLAIELLDVKEDDRVADYCCGHGGVAIGLGEKSQCSVKGFELNERTAETAKIRVLASKANVEISVCDVFEIPKKNQIFDKIFSNYPFGLHLRELGSRNPYLQSLSEKVPGISRATSSDWVFNHLLIDSLSEKGKAIGIMTNGSTLNSIDRKTREYFVENGYIECVIALPAKLFSSTGIATTLVVLSHGNKKVRMVNAVDICTKGRRQNVLSDSDIEKILDACKDDSNISKEVSLDDLYKADYVLHPNRYFVGEADYLDGVPFETVIKKISRGAHCTAEQLDDMSSQEETNIHFLKTSDIQDGIIAGRMQALSYIEKNFEKYCIQDRNLVISKVGFPYKVIVAEVDDSARVLANANLFIIELDESKADPYYLKAFFESEEGQACLRRITVGATIPSIGVKELKTMRIPLPSIEVQREIGTRCKDVLGEITQLKKQLENATKRLSGVVSENK